MQIDPCHTYQNDQTKHKPMPKMQVSFEYLSYVDTLFVVFIRGSCLNHVNYLFAVNKDIVVTMSEVNVIIIGPVVLQIVASDLLTPDGSTYTTSFCLR